LRWRGIRRPDRKQSRAEMRREMRVLGLGDSIVDRYYYQKKMYPGGNAYNFAVKAKQMGAEAAFMGKIANDSAKDTILRPLREMGIDISHCQYGEGENGYTEVTLENGDRTIGPGNYGGIVTKDPLRFSEDDIEYLRTFQIVHTSCYSGIDEQILYLAGRGVRFTYDFSSEFTEEQMRSLCPVIAYGLFSCESLEKARETVRKAYSYGLGCAVSTAGNAGAAVCTEIGLTEAFGLKLKKEPLDTMGCGDAFFTGFILANEASEQLYYASLDGSDHLEELEEESVMRYIDAAVRHSIYQGHFLAAKSCFVPGGVGYGEELEPAG